MNINQAPEQRKIFVFPAVIYSPETTLAFGAVGNYYFKLSHDASQALSFKQMKPSFGTGLRIAIDKKEKLNVRFDFGIGQNSNGFYFNIIEAF